MQNQTSNNKNVIMAVVLIVLLVVAYFMFFKGEDLAPTDALVSENIGPDGLPIAGDGLTAGADLLPMLLRLNSLHLDDTIFQDPVFLSLEDFTIEIPPQPQGRSNPFAPLSGSSASSRIPSPRLPSSR